MHSHHFLQRVLVVWAWQVVPCIRILVEEQRAEPHGLEVAVVFGNGDVGDCIAGQAPVSTCFEDYQALEKYIS